MTIAPATTIDEVLDALDRIMDWSLEKNSRLGYFPALYRRVTARVKEGIENDEFSNGKIMERLDVIFANRYLIAFDGYLNDKQHNVPDSWAISFEGATTSKPLVLQHLMAGMNAHIHFDLGLAASETVSGDVSPIKEDFYKINQVLGDMIDEVQLDLAEFWFGFSFFDRMAGRLDEKAAAFGIRISRDKAWKVAAEMANAKQDEKQDLITNLDQRISALGKKILYPFWLWPGTMIMLAKLAEKKDIRTNIECLRYANV